VTLAAATSDIAVAILTWRGEAASRQCLESVRALAPAPAAVAIVDNDSGTGEGIRLAAEFGVEALTLPANGGVAGGYNAAISWARDRSRSHVLLLNNDVLIRQTDLLGRFAGALTAPRIAAVGPVIQEADGSIWSAGGRMWRAVGHASRRRNPSASTAYDVDWIDGSAMLMSVDACCATGGLAQDYFLYWEETDWCTRARRAGYRVVVEPSAVITHQRGGTVPALTTRRYALRNSLLFVRRNLRGWRALTATAFWLVVRVPVFVVRVSRAHGPRAAAAGLRDAIAWHARDTRRRGWSLEADGPEMCVDPGSAL
jgi:GT2 family glycosyltransferase